MSCVQPQRQPTARAMAMATTLGNQGMQFAGVGNAFDWLVERFGPALSELLIDLLIKKSQQGIMPGAVQDAMGAFDIKGLMALVLERLGPALIEEAAKKLDARPDLLSKLVASAIRQYSAQVIGALVQWLHSAEGSQAVQNAVASTVTP